MPNMKRLIMTLFCVSYILWLIKICSTASVASPSLGCVSVELTAAAKCTRHYTTLVLSHTLIGETARNITRPVVFTLVAAPRKLILPIKAATRNKNSVIQGRFSPSIAKLWLLQKLICLFVRSHCRFGVEVRAAIYAVGFEPTNLASKLCGGSPEGLSHRDRPGTYLTRRGELYSFRFQ